MMRRARAAVSTLLPASTWPPPFVLNVPLSAAVNGTAAACLLRRNAKRSAAPRTLTDGGIRHAGVLGFVLWSCGGAKTWAFCALFLLSGRLLTRIGGARKRANGTYEKREGARGPANVWGAGAVPAAFAVVSALLRASPELPATANAMQLAYVASLCTKMWDTAASEIGQAYGRTTLRLVDLRRVPNGTDGAVSAEGTIAGCVFSAAYAGVAIAMGLVPPSSLLTLMTASTLANVGESLIGGTLQRRQLLSNEGVNVVNTALGALVALLLHARRHRR